MLFAKTNGLPIVITKLRKSYRSALICVNYKRLLVSEVTVLAYQPSWSNGNIDLLVRALLSLDNEEDAYRLLDDLCTVAEVQAMAQRLAVASLLAQNTTYNAIASETGASTATISRVKRCLNYGADGYKRVLNRMIGELKDEK